MLSSVEWWWINNGVEDKDAPIFLSKAKGTYVRNCNAVHKYVFQLFLPNKYFGTAFPLKLPKLAITFVGKLVKLKMLASPDSLRNDPHF